MVPVYNNAIRMTMGPFVHGSLSGVFGYFIGLAAVDRGRRVALFLAGLGLSSVLHGLYDTGVSTSPLFGLAIQAVTFFILMTYILKARGLTSAREIGGGVFSRTVMLRPAAGPRQAAEAPAATSVVARTEAAPEATTGAEPAPATGGATASTWRLRGVAGPPAGRAYALDGEVRLGRDASRCAIHVDEVTVSREHAVLVPDVGRATWLIRRLSRLQPLYVNGQQVEEAALSPGDQIQVGSWVFIIEAA